jgi:hypothetical protein
MTPRTEKFDGYGNSSADNVVHINIGRQGRGDIHMGFFHTSWKRLSNPVRDLVDPCLKAFRGAALRLKPVKLESLPDLNPGEEK